MSTKQLAMIDGVKMAGLTPNWDPIYNFPRNTTFEEVTFSSSLSTGAKASGTKVIIECVPAYSERYKIEEEWLEFLVDDAVAADDLIWRNMFARLHSVRVLFDNDEVLYLRTLGEILQQVRIHFASRMRDRNDTLMYYTNNADNTLEVTDVAATNDQLRQLPLSVLIPQIKGLDSKLVGKITYEIVFASDTGTAVSNGLFCASSSTNNPYAQASITYKDLKIRRTITRFADQSDAIYKTPGMRLIKTCHEVKQYSLSAYSASSTNPVQIVRLNKDFAQHSCVRGMAIYVDTPSIRTAYNDADNCKYLSGPDLIGFKIMKDGKPLLDYSHATTNLKQRRDYAQMINQKNFNENIPYDVLSRSATFGTYIMGVGLTYIDFTNSNLFFTHDDVVSTGITTNDNIEIWVYASGSLAGGAAAVNLMCALEFQEEIVRNGKGWTVNQRL